MNVIEFLSENMRFLAIAIYIVGIFLKSTPKIPNWLIPWILLVIGNTMAVWILGLNPEAFIEGTAVTGYAVLGNQLIKQGSEMLQTLNN